MLRLHDFKYMKVDVFYNFKLIIESKISSNKDISIVIYDKSFYFKSSKLLIRNYETS